MTDERTTGFAELKAVALDILQHRGHHDEQPPSRTERGSSPMDTRDQRRHPQLDTATGKTSTGGAAAPADADSAQGEQDRPGSRPTPQEQGQAQDQGRAGGRQDKRLESTSDRQDNYGAGMDTTAPAADGDDKAWPPRDWDENGNANRHGQSREGRGPGGYEDRSRELRDFGPGPEGSTGEAWRSYEHHADSGDGQEPGDVRRGQAEQEKPPRDDQRDD